MSRTLDVCGIHHHANPCPGCRREPTADPQTIADIRAQWGVQSGRAKVGSPRDARLPVPRSNDLDATRARAEREDQR